MPELDWSFVSTVISSVTAVIAIVAPVVTSIITVKSQERMKKMELYSPRVYDALAEMSQRYSQLPRSYNSFDEESKHKEYLEAIAIRQKFIASCYVVMSLIPGKGIQQQISDLVKSFDRTMSPSTKQDEMFCHLVSDINEYMITSKVKNEKQCTKD